MRLGTLRVPLSYTEWVNDVLRSIRIHVLIPVGMLEDLDQHATAKALSRSDFVRIALMEKMGRQNMIDPPATKPTYMHQESWIDDPGGLYWPD